MTAVSRKVAPPGSMEGEGWIAEAFGFEWLDIKYEHLLSVATLPLFDAHRDPFDRLLVAQGQTEPLVLLTSDAKLARYGSTVRVV